MLTILEAKADFSQKIKEELKTVKDNFSVFVCAVDGVEKGYIAVDIDGYILNIRALVIYSCADQSAISTDEFLYADSLLRAVGSFALSHSCFYIECSEKELYALLTKFRFAENNNKLSINLKQLFNVCKN